MAQKTALMEWLEQTKRLNKEEDYMGLEIIDTVMENLWIVCPELIRRHRSFFNELCDAYHKPNPVSYLSANKREAELRVKHGDLTIHEWQASMCRQPRGYPPNGCRAFKFFRKAISKQIDLQIERYKKASEVLTWQWFEVIDFMFERPELVNPSLLDDYIIDKINQVCDEHRKNNPLKNGMLKRFGRYWKNGQGHWEIERRKRF